MSDALTAAVVRAIKLAPCSVRRLALEADLPQPLLWAIVKGRRRATERTAERVARALERWAFRCLEAAISIREHHTGGEP